MHKLVSERRKPGKNEGKMEVRAEKQKEGWIQFRLMRRLVLTASSHWRLFQVQINGLVHFKPLWLSRFLGPESLLLIQLRLRNCNMEFLLSENNMMFF